MNEERHNERDSQLSAMFDGELPGAECELLARRLTRDELLRAQWSRFAMIGAALRAERGVALHDRVAWRVQSLVAQELSYGDGTNGDGAVDVAVTSTRTPALVPADGSRVSTAARWLRFARPVAGASIAAGVAAMSIFWLQTQDPVDSGADQMLAANPLPESIVLTPDTIGTQVVLDTAAETRASNGEPDRYVTPAPSSSASIAPPARLANYVVAHSEYSGPLSRRMALLGLVATDPADGAVIVDEPTGQPTGQPAGQPAGVTTTGSADAR
jgi:negative regulator of sigma E activity